MPRLIFHALFFLIIAAYYLRASEIRAIHIDNKATQFVKIEGRENKIHNTAIFKKLNAIVPEGYTVLNTRSFEDTEAMFYSDRNAYHWWLSESDFMAAKAAGHKFAIFKDFSVQVVPEYIKSDPETFVISEELR